MENRNAVFLVYDTVETNGLFVLAALAETVLSSASSAKTDGQELHRVLWLCCSTMTDHSTLYSLQKIGCSKDITSLALLPDNPGRKEVTTAANDESTRRLTIRSVPSLIESVILRDNAEVQLNEESFARDLFDIVRTWLLQRKNSESDCVILDDISALASLLGDRLTFGLVSTLCSLAKSEQLPFKLAFRCSNDCEIEKLGLTIPRERDWFGSTTSSRNADGGNDDLIPWERFLVELSDFVIDVIPLASGYTRETQGQLVVTEQKGLFASTTYNYVLTDNHVAVIKIL
jgi:hypothetical protein